jgi:DNA-directed RNA polymerase specialized sigma24 family protein
LRVPLVLHYIEGLPINQIADLTGKTEGAIKVSLHRARTLLRKELENA